MFKTILFPIDMSPEAHQAAHLAIELVKAAPKSTRIVVGGRNPRICRKSGTVL
jgi:nucleotide-binding universal stress UspA family protein